MNQTYKVLVIEEFRFTVESDTLENARLKALEVPKRNYRGNNLKSSSITVLDPETGDYLDFTTNGIGVVTCGNSRGIKKGS
tara:strand:+ start:374 stop:616 length:243 start_codon:yes stop_codon:yes gene_type:complete